MKNTLKIIIIIKLYIVPSTYYKGAFEISIKILKLLIFCYLIVLLSSSPF